MIQILLDEEKQAYGVEYIRHGVKHAVHASKEVIVSAGSIDSPKLLMLSGIGNRDELEQLGVSNSSTLIIRTHGISLEVRIEEILHIYMKSYYCTDKINSKPACRW